MMPRRLFPRLVVVLLVVLIAYVAVTLLLLRASVFEPLAQHTARTLETEIVAADALLASPDRAAADARLEALGMRRAATPDERRSRLPVWRAIETLLLERMPQRALHITPEPQPTLWVVAARAEDGWIGIPMLGLRASLRGANALAFLAAIALVTAGAAWATRALVGPLRLLADAAPRIAAGEAAPPLPQHAPEEIRELASALDRAAADTRAAAREREILLAGFSHDMRTPLARLALAVEMIEGDAELKRGMASDVEELDAMTGQFVAFVGDGRDESTREVDLGTLLDERLAAQTRAGREWTRSGLDHAHVEAKPIALRRALDNLLENAARHGRAPFEADLSMGHGEARIAIRDRGPGVPPSVLADLGKPFFRGDAARRGAGSGLGLAIAARFAAAQGGSLRFANREGGGFEATLTLMRSSPSPARGRGLG